MGALGHRAKRGLKTAKTQWRRLPLPLLFAVFLLRSVNPVASETSTPRRRTAPVETHHLADTKTKSGQSGTRGLASAVDHRHTEGEGTGMDALERLVAGAMGDLQSDRAALRRWTPGTARGGRGGVRDKGRGPVPLSSLRGQVLPGSTPGARKAHRGGRAGRTKVKRKRQAKPGGSKVGGAEAPRSGHTVGSTSPLHAVGAPGARERAGLVRGRRISATGGAATRMLPLSPPPPHRSLLQACHELVEAASQHLGEARSRLQASASSTGPDLHDPGVPRASMGAAGEGSDAWSKGGDLNESRSEPGVRRGGERGEGVAGTLGFSAAMDALHAMSAARTLRSLCSDDVARSGLPAPLPAALPSLDSAISVARRAVRSLEPIGEAPLDPFPHSTEPSNSKSNSTSNSSWHSNSDSNRDSVSAAAAPKGETGKVRTKWGIYADVVVDQEGNGDYKDLQGAIAAAPLTNRRPYVIYIRKGYYRTILQIRNSNILLVGDGPHETVLWGDRSFHDSPSTLGSANIVVLGNSFGAVGITFYNPVTTAQAIALLVSSDKAVFWNCRFRGYQDTLCTLSGRQFYQDCEIYGYVDFIFGNAAAVFQWCTIHETLNSKNGPGIIMASGRGSADDPTGLVFKDGRILPYKDGAMAYLGRPWKGYARMVYINTYMGNVIMPDGWLSWNGNLWGNKPFYGEYMSSGPGARKRRVAWAKPGQLSLDAANYFSPRRFLDFPSWIHATGMPRAFFKNK